MRWSERQQALLAEIGIRHWAPVRLAPATDAAALPAAPAMPQAPAAGARSGHEEPAASRAPAAPAASTAPSASTTPTASTTFAAPTASTTSNTPTAPASPTSPASVAALGGPALRAAVAACTACRLCESRRQPVFGAGPEPAGWMLVGESPGELDDQQGEPFAGKPGELLDNMLRSVGVARGEASGSAAAPVFVTHAVKCRPPGGRVPRVDELAACEHFLLRQVELVRPNVILAMGTVAVQSLLRSDEPIGRLRGRVHRFHGVPLVVTYDPAYLLRNPQDKARAWDDLCLASETVAAAGAAAAPV